MRTPARWKNARFTYHSEEKLSERSIVQVPFGKGYRVGYVTEKVAKPSFATKPIYAVSGDKLPVHSVQFLDWLRFFYTANDNELQSLLLPSYLRVPKKLDSVQQQSLLPVPPLSKQQKKAFNEIYAKDSPTLLRGVTGSGKTRIYMHLIAKNLQLEKSTLLLLPEILLTTQLVAELEKHFPCVVFHSKLTDSQRSKLWFQVLRAEKPLVVIGARSSLFLPYQDLGLIIIDEAHDGSYKQDSDVRYNGIMVAGGLSSIYKSKLVLGSATPPVTESYLLLKRNGYLVNLPDKAIASQSPPTIQIIDRGKRDSFSKHPLLSNPLLEHMSQTLGNGKQSLLFLNRRGTARLLTCENGDWHASCPRCDLPLTYHHDLHMMLCHSCGYKTSPLSVCPLCDGRLKTASMGVKSIASDLAKLFPKATIGRYDSDTDVADAFFTNYHEIKKGSVDIIVGTQQLTKGLDLPLLETVGIIDADLPLNFPDFSSGERQFQLIAQVAGRVNRGHGESNIIVQTADPNNSVIHQALTEDWETYYKTELQSRKKHGFPPSTFTAKLLFRDKSEKKAITRAEESRRKIKHSVVLGPMPSFQAKRGSHYYYQLIVRNKNRTQLVQELRPLAAEALIDLDPTTLL